MAIEPVTKCTIEVIAEDSIIITSTDKESEVVLPLHGISHDHEVGLISKAVSFFRPVKGLRMSLSSGVPKGSGLGASSSLLVSLIKCMNSLPSTAIAHPRIENWEKMVTIAQGIETWHLQVPTGQQDYLAAIHGGLKTYDFGIGGLKINEPCDSDFCHFLADHVVVYYSGQSHLSSLPNWKVFQSRVNKLPAVVNALGELKKIAKDMDRALRLEDFDTFSKLLGKEWKARKRLSPSVTTPAIERIMKKANSAGAISGKTAGAGGGGCVFFITKDTEKLAGSLKEEKGRIIDCSFYPSSSFYPGD